MIMSEKEFPDLDIEPVPNKIPYNKFGVDDLVKSYEEELRLTYVTGSKSRFKKVSERLKRIFELKEQDSGQRAHEKAVDTP